MQELFEIQKLKDKEEKELALENFLNKYPDHAYGLALKANLATSKFENTKAKAYLIELNKKTSSIRRANDSHWQRRLLAFRSCSAGEEIEGLEKDLMINHMMLMHISRLLICLKIPGNTGKPESIFEKGLTIDSQSANAHAELASLLEYYYEAFEEAKKRLELAITIDPHYAEAHYGLASLPEREFRAYDEAKKHYDE